MTFAKGMTALPIGQCVNKRGVRRVHACSPRNFKISQSRSRSFLSVESVIGWLILVSAGACPATPIGPTIFSQFLMRRFERILSHIPDEDG
jgi:hypothetical protein